MDPAKSFEDLTEDFSAWLRRKDVRMSPKIQLADLRRQQAGRGVVATEDINFDEDLFSIPRSSILLPETSSMPSTYMNGLDDPWLKLILTMIWEHQQGPESEWQPYLDVLPDHFNTLMYWSDNELLALQGSAVVDKIGKTTAEQTFAEKIFPIITAHKTEFHAEQLSKQDLLDLFHRMGSTIMAYAFDLEASSGDDKSVGSDDWQEDTEEDALGMVPLADMLNASGDKNNAKLYYEADKVVMRSIKAIKKGQEIFNDYGALPRADLLRRYGYITYDYIQYDVVEFDRDWVARVASSWRQLPLKDVNDRLEYLEELGMPTDGFEIVHEQQDERLVCAELLTFANTLILSDEEYAQLKSKKARPERGAMPMNMLATGFMVQLITERLAQYDRAGPPPKTDSLAAARRVGMGLQIVAGERDILNKAFMRVQDTRTSEEITAEHKDESERPHKRART